MKMKSLRSFSLAAVSLCMLTLSLPSQAIPISVASNTHNFSWSFDSAAGLLSGTGTMVLTGFNTNTLSVAVTLNNTSGLSSNRLTSFGFGISPDATGVAFSDATDRGMISASMSDLPGIKTVEVCAYGGPNNCNGGGNGGIYGGRSDAFTLLLGGNWGGLVDIDPIGFKYQTGSGSFHFTTGNGGSVPEPGPLALFVVGLVGMMVWPRRKAA